MPSQYRISDFRKFLRDHVSKGIKVRGGSCDSDRRNAYVRGGKPYGRFSPAEVFALERLGIEAGPGPAIFREKEWIAILEEEKRKRKEREKGKD